MTRYRMNDVKPGLKITVDGEPCVITEVDFHKPGKGQATTRVNYRSLASGRTHARVMTRTDTLEAADIIETDMIYLHQDGEFWHFLHPQTHEHYTADAAAMVRAAKWLKGEETCLVTLWNDTPLIVIAPNFVDLEVVQTDPGVRGDTTSGGSKFAQLETGAMVRVPLFVAQGETIRVDTRSGEYVARVRLQ